MSSYKEQMLDATRNVSLTEKEMSNLKGQINETSLSLANFKIDSFKSKMDNVSTILDGASKKIKDFGSKISGAGNKLTLGITAPIVALAKVTTDLASDNEENLNKVQATFEDNSQSIIDWSKTTLDAYGIASGSALEYASTIGDMLKGIGFGKDKIGDMSKTIIGMSADIASFKNSSPEEVFSAISAAMTGEYEQLKKYGYVINESILNEYAKSKGIKKTTKEMTLQEKALLALSKIQDYAKDAAGDFAKTADGNANSNRIFKESLKELGATIGQELLPTMTPLVQEATKLIKEFANMDEATRKNVVKFGMYAAAAGPVLSVTGKLVSLTGGIVGFFGKSAGAAGKTAEKFKKTSKSIDATSKSSTSLSKGFGLLNSNAIVVAGALAGVAAVVKLVKTNNDVMNKGISYTTDEMTLLEKVVSKFNGTNAKSRKELENSGLMYKEFSEDISPEFQEKVKENTKTLNDFRMKLAEINFDGVISEDESNSFVEAVNNACTSAINAVKSRQEESNKAMTELFLSDGVMSSSERRVLEFMSKNSEIQITEINKLKDEILSIEQKAIEDKRKLSDEEIQLIQDKRARIAQIELESLGNNQQEILYAQNEFNERIKNIDIEGAKQIIAEKVKIRNDEAVKIAAGYDTQIALMKEKLSEATGEDKKALEEQITNLEKSKNDKLQKNNELYQGYIDILNEKNPQLMENINKFTGEELTNADLRKQELLNNMKEQYDGLNTITEDGNYMMLNNTTGKLVELSVSVDEHTGEIIGIYDNYNKVVGGYSKNICDKVQSMGDAHKINKEVIRDALNDMANCTVDASGNIIDANGRTVLSLQNVKNNADGTKEGVLNLNGTPINIKADTDGAISNLDEVDRAVDNIPSAKKVTVTAFFKKVGDGIANFFGFAEGTNYAPRGVALVAEEGQELIEKNGKFILTDNSGPQLFNFSGGEKVYTAEETKKMLSSKQVGGGFFTPNSIESRSLVNNTVNNYRTINSSNSSSDVDINALANVFADTVARALANVKLQGNVVLDNGALLGTVSNGLATKTKSRR
ncbi:phage tail tape measure protein [Fusobacterium varium]